MKIITRQILANGAAERWATQYSYLHWGKEKKQIGEELKALGSNPNPDDVDRIIGNTAWTSVPECDECSKKTEVVIEMGQEPDHDSHTAQLCFSCLNKAVKKFSEEKPDNTNECVEAMKEGFLIRLKDIEDQNLKLKSVVDAVAAFANCEEAADWKDAFGRLTRMAINALSEEKNNDGFAADLIEGLSQEMAKDTDNDEAMHCNIDLDWCTYICPCGATLCTRGVTIGICIDWINCHKQHTNGKMIEHTTADGNRAWSTTQPDREVGL